VPDPDRPGSDFLSRLHPQRGRVDRRRGRPRQELQHLSLGQSIATFIGPSLAGFTIDALGFRPTFVALASISLVVVLLALAFPRMVPPRGEHHDERETRRAFDLLKEAPLRRTLIMSGVALTGIELFSFYMPVYGQSIGLSATRIGLVLSAYAAAAFVVRPGDAGAGEALTEAGC